MNDKMVKASALAKQGIVSWSQDYATIIVPKPGDEGGNDVKVGGGPALTVAGVTDFEGVMVMAGFSITAFPKFPGPQGLGCATAVGPPERPQKL